MSTFDWQLILGHGGRVRKTGHFLMSKSHYFTIIGGLKLCFCIFVDTTAKGARSS